MLEQEIEHYGGAASIWEEVWAFQVICSVHKHFCM